MSITPKAVSVIADSTDTTTATSWNTFPEIEIKSGDMMIITAVLSRKTTFMYLEVEDAITWGDPDIYAFPSDKTCQIVVWSKVATADDEVPTRVRSIYASTSNIMRATLTVVSGINAIEEITVTSDITTASSLVTYPTIDVEDNSLILYCATTDVQDFTTFPQMQKLTDNTEYQVGYTYAPTATTEGGFQSDRVNGDEYVAVAIELSRNTNDIPFYSQPYNPITSTTLSDYQYIINKIKDAGKLIDGTTANTFTMTDGTISSSLAEGRIYYISNSTITNMPDGYYQPDSNSTTPIFRSCNGGDGLSISYYFQGSDITPDTGTCDIQDVGILNNDESVLSAGNLNYQTRNITGFVKEITETDLTDKNLKIYFNKHTGNRMDTIYVILMDSSDNYKIFESYNGTESSLQEVFIDPTSEQIFSSDGTFDEANTKYIGLFYSSSYNDARLYPTQNFDVNIIEDITYNNIDLDNDLYLAEEFLLSQQGVLGYILRGNAKFTGRLNKSVTTLGYPVQGWDFIRDDNTIDLVFDNITGNLSDTIITSDVILNITKTNNSINTDGNIWNNIKFSVDEPLSNSSFGNCQQIDINTDFIDCKVKNSSDDCPINWISGNITGGSINSNDHAIEIKSAGDYEIIDTDIISTNETFNVTATTGTVNITTNISGVDYVTAGATVNIIAPVVNYTLQFPNIIDDSRFQIINQTTGTELKNAVASGGIDEVFVLGTDYTSGDVGRYRITYQNGLVAKDEIEGLFVFGSSTTVNTNPIVQINHSTYIENNVDGSTITEFTWDSGNIQIDINDADNYTVIQRIGSWYYHFITTEVGIRETFNSIEWLTINDVLLNTDIVDMTLDNIKSTPLLIRGGRIHRKDGATVIASTSNSIHLDYDPVYQLETGVSGLTSAESAQLNNINTTVDTNLDAKVSEVGGMTETDLHNGLDTYTNKDDYKATTTISSNMRGTDNAITSLTGIATSANITASQTVIVDEINDNETKLDTIIAKDNFNATDRTKLNSLNNTDISTLATKTVQDSILEDTNELQTNQGNFATATGFATASDLAIVDSNIDAIKIVIDTNLDAKVSEVGGMSITELHNGLDSYANKGDYKATTTISSNMRGTDNAITSLNGIALESTLLAVKSVIDTNLDAKVSEVDSLTISELHNGLDSYSNKDGYKATTTISSNMRGTDGAITSLSGIALESTLLDVKSVIDTNLDAKVSEVDSLTISELHTGLDSYTNKDSYKATTTISSNMRGTDNALTGASGLALESTSLSIKNVIDTNLDMKVSNVEGLTISELHNGLDSYTNKGDYKATTTISSNMRGTDNAITDISTLATKTTQDLILGDTNELQTNQGNFATATGFATPSDINNSTNNINSNIAIIDNNVDAIKTVIDTNLDMKVSNVEGLTISELHNGLDSYINKGDYKSDATLAKQEDILIKVETLSGDLVGIEQNIPTNVWSYKRTP